MKIYYGNDKTTNTYDTTNNALPTLIPPTHDINLRSLLQPNHNINYNEICADILLHLHDPMQESPTLKEHIVTTNSITITTRNYLISITKLNI